MTGAQCHTDTMCPRPVSSLSVCHPVWGPKAPQQHTQGSEAESTPLGSTTGGFHAHRHFGRSGFGSAPRAPAPRPPSGWPRGRKRRDPGNGQALQPRVPGTWGETWGTCSGTTRRRAWAEKDSEPGSQPGTCAHSAGGRASSSGSPGAAAAAAWAQLPGRPAVCPAPSRKGTGKRPHQSGRPRARGSP